MKYVKLLGTGKYLPGNPVPFAEVEDYLGPIAAMPAKLRAYIERMKPTMRDVIGMDYYYYALDRETRQPTETHGSMAAKASRRALEQSSVDANEIDFIAFGGAILERLVSPPTSTFVQQELGIRTCAEMSIHANCTASYKAMQVAYDAIRLGRYKTVLVASSSIISSVFREEYYNPEKLNRNQALLRWFLCDGAGAMVLQGTDEIEDGGLYLEGVTLDSVGGDLEPGMYTKMMGHELLLPKVFETGAHHFTQDLSKVAEIGPGIFMDACQRMMTEFHIDLDTITYFLANIPNKMFMDNATTLAQEKYGMDPKRFYSSLRERGYCGPPAILITLDDLLSRQQIQPGESIASVVTESSKWMNAGFLFRQY